VPLPLATAPAAGSANLTEESKATEAPAVANSGANGLSLNAQGWSVHISSTNLEGQPSPLDAKSRVVLEGGQYAHAEGFGFLPNTEVHLYIFGAPTLMGILMTDASGNFNGSVPVPAGLSVGEHTLQVAGYSLNRTLRWASIQAVVQAPVGKVLTAKYFFKPNSAWVSDANRSALKKLAGKVAKGYTDLKVGVVGFVYHYDTKAANARVSTARAKNVAALLKKYGLKGVFVAVGKGRAIETDKTARRVEVTVTYKVKATN
jgi:flagellar motor protein MotB